MKTFTQDKLNVKIFENRKIMGENAALDIKNAIVEMLKKKEELNIVFAAAPSQSDMLQALIADKDIEWNRINGYHMDEYVGISPEQSQSFVCFLKRSLFDLVPFKTVQFLNGLAKDEQAECQRYATLLKENRPDIVVMGIGENGHIAFNDPWVAKFNDEEIVKTVALDSTCLQQQVNDGCFEKVEDVPTRAFTLTIPSLLNTDAIFCVVPAPTKAKAVVTTLEGDITEDCPASILRTHKNATLYLDADSASLLIGK